MLTWSGFYPDRPLPVDPMKYFRDFALDDIIQVLIWVKNHLQIPEKYPELIDSLIRRMGKEKQYNLLNQLELLQLSTTIVIDKILVEVFRSHTLKVSERSIDENGFEDQLLDLLLYFNHLHYETHFHFLGFFGEN